MDDFKSEIQKIEAEIISIIGNKSEKCFKWTGYSKKRNRVELLLKCLKNPPTQSFPYGWESLQVADWTNPENFLLINNHIVYNWIENKIKAIRDEIDTRGLPMSCVPKE